MFGTTLHVITFIFIVIQSIITIPLIVLTLSNLKENYRARFLLLNTFFLIYNLSNGLIPGTTISLDIKSQYYITFAIGIITSVYLFDYLYKDHKIKPFRYEILKKLILWMFIWYVVFFVVIYSATDNLFLSRYVFYLYPISVGVLGIYKFFKWVIKTKTFVGTNYHKYRFYSGIAGMLSLFLFPVVLVVFPENQPIERSVYNAGYFVMMLFFFYKVYYVKKIDFQELPNDYVFNEIYRTLTQRQKEILKKIYISPDKSYEALSKELHITLSTFSTHTAKLYKAFNLENKTKKGLVSYLNDLKRDI